MGGKTSFSVPFSACAANRRFLLGKLPTLLSYQHVHCPGPRDPQWGPNKWSAGTGQIEHLCGAGTRDASESISENPSASRPVRAVRP